MDPGDLRRALVERLVARRSARSPSVIRALAEVPRHLFLPDVPPETAYADRSIALIVENGVTLSSISQPSMIGEMLEQLDVQPGDRVLEIGTGTGYNAALLARLCGPFGCVVTIDLDAGLIERARTALHATGFENVRVLLGDGAAGAPEWAPFDRIILTVASDDIVDPWRLQLSDGGRLVMPLTMNALQESVAFEGRDPLRGISIVGASFVALRGSSAIASCEYEIGSSPVIRLRGGEPGLDHAAITRHLEEMPAFVLLEGISVDDVWGGLDLWLDAHVAEAAVAMASGSGSGACIEEWLSVAYDDHRFATTLALCRGDAVAFFIRDGRERVGLAAFGEAGALIDVAREAIARWLRRGRPRNRSLEMTAHARTQPPFADAIIKKATVTLALRWTNSG